MRESISINASNHLQEPTIKRRLKKLAKPLSILALIAFGLAASSCTLGPLRSASQGVFQITPAFSNEVSGGGYNDTSSLDKVIKAVVTVEYAIREQ